jgi:4a-hydroxytetrahydrobiopterin dehydratase
VAEPQQISESQFHEAEGVDDWRALFWGAKAHYLTSDFGSGAAFVAGIAEVVEELDHPPLIDLRMDTVTVTVLTIGVGLSDRDLVLAQRISALASERGIPSDPSAVQHVQLAMDAADPEAVLQFWQAALDYARVGPNDIVDKNLIGPSMWFQEKQYVSPRNRLHVDVSLPADQAQARIDAVLAAGGRVLGDKYGPAWVSLVDPEGNVVDIATWEGRENLES